LCWGIVFLAPVADRAVRRVLIGASVFSCFLGLPGAHVLIRELAIANPWFVALFSVVLVALAMALVRPRLRQRGSERAPALELELELESAH
ncbi:MAG TPA: hypothetical protein VG368_03580, partial [Acidimicrobiales bacterium]|nr:hypothetical protein [Acidimicrobiales bacterium]